MVRVADKVVPSTREYRRKVKVPPLMLLEEEKLQFICERRHYRIEVAEPHRNC